MWQAAYSHGRPLVTSKVKAEADTPGKMGDRGSFQQDSCKKMWLSCWSVNVPSIGQLFSLKIYFIYLEEFGVVVVGEVGRGVTERWFSCKSIFQMAIMARTGPCLSQQSAVSSESLMWVQGSTDPGLLLLFLGAIVGSLIGSGAAGT